MLLCRYVGAHGLSALLAARPSPSLNARDDEGRTALHHVGACLDADMDDGMGPHLDADAVVLGTGNAAGVAAKLLACGAIPCLRDGAGRNPYEAALAAGDAPVVAALTHAARLLPPGRGRGSADGVLPDGRRLSDVWRRPPGVEVFVAGAAELVYDAHSALQDYEAGYKDTGAAIATLRDDIAAAEKERAAMAPRLEALRADAAASQARMRGQRARWADQQAAWRAECARADEETAALRSRPPPPEGAARELQLAQAEVRRAAAARARECAATAAALAAARGEARGAERLLRGLLRGADGGVGERALAAAAVAAETAGQPGGAGGAGSGDGGEAARPRRQRRTARGG